MSAEEVVYVDAEGLADLLGGALRQRQASAAEDRLRVMREDPATLARLAPADDMTALVAELNLVDRGPGSEVVFVDRWAAARLTARADGLLTG